MNKNRFSHILVGIGILIFAVLIIFGNKEHTPRSAAIAGGDYLISHMYEDGSFVYEYDPIKQEESDFYNILRHAGTTYSLIELYEATGEIKYLSGAQKALAYLLIQTIPCPNDPEALCILEENEIKLGGNGLGLLAITKHLDVADATLLGKIGTSFVRKDMENHAQRLARFIVTLQEPSGEFSVHKIDASGVADDFESEYYPGEAIFALARLSELTGEKKWMDAAHRGAKWLIEVRDRGVTTSDLPHDHWLLYGLNELHADNQDPLYVEHAKRLVDAITTAQHRDKTGEQSAWNGGYYNPPRSTPTATRNEGLGAAYEIFMRAGETAYAEVAKETMRRGIDFTLRTQFTPKKIRALNVESSVLGGFHEGLEEYTIRIDYVQHNISALLAFDRITKEK